MSDPQKRKLAPPEEKTKNKRIDRTYTADVYMMQDRQMIAKNITRKNLQVYLNLPKKKEGEKGLFDSIISG